VRSGQKIKARKHLVILGDVNPGAEIEAGGDILIMGTLGGKASAGVPDNTQAIILALDLRPTQLQIGGIVAAGEPGTRGNGIEYARVEEGMIVVSDYGKTNPFKHIQWPEMR
jgi:septum site-determining protein MinC